MDPFSILGAVAGPITDIFMAGRQRREDRATRAWSAKEQRLAEARAETYQIRAEKRAWKRQKKISDPAYIRKRAEKAGFHPLVFAGPSPVSADMGMGTGAAAPSPVYGTPTGQNVGSLIAQGFNSLDEANYRAEQLAIDKARLEMDAAQAREIAENAKFRPTVPGIYGVGGVGAVAQSDMAPTFNSAADGARAKPNPFDDMWTVYMPDGTPAQFPSDQLKRLGIMRPYSSLSAGDLPELLGEIGGEGYNVTHTAKYVGDAGVPLLGNPVPGFGERAARFWRDPDGSGRGSILMGSHVKDFVFGAPQRGASGAW